MVNLIIAQKIKGAKRQAAPIKASLLCKSPGESLPARPGLFMSNKISPRAYQIAYENVNAIDSLHQGDN